MVSLQLAGFLDASQPTMADSELNEDFASTRDGSDGQSSVFTYKSLKQESEATSLYRGELERHIPSFFGELDRIVSLEPGAHFRLRCPNDVRCSVKRVYYRQIARLKALLAWDDADIRGWIKSSWFRDDDMDMFYEDGCIYVRLMRDEDSGWSIKDTELGTLVGTWVSLERKESQGIGEMCRDYKLSTNFVVPITCSTTELKQVGYRCDLTAGGCAFC
ncbi:hypothetical protein B0H16DRAFT_802823 [Mycena metata]|uniref:Uncharacterized protein n=1 Tax=Mycena metata TaxID=1033252 RepID=A0AAD7NXA0_9AGAR|nr:hypothetical protein B0H16DRAFT_802823 [Mycena metata]